MNRKYTFEMWDCFQFVVNRSIKSKPFQYNSLFKFYRLYLLPLNFFIKLIWNRHLRKCGQCE